jgi:hypothetical protein
MYTCAKGAVAPPPPPGPPKIQGKRYSVVNYTGDTQNPHDFIVDWKAPGLRAWHRGRQRSGLPPR